MYVCTFTMTSRISTKFFSVCSSSEAMCLRAVSSVLWEYEDAAPLLQVPTRGLMEPGDFLVLLRPSKQHQQGREGGGGVGRREISNTCTDA